MRYTFCDSESYCDGKMLSRREKQIFLHPGKKKVEKQKILAREARKKLERERRKNERRLEKERE